MRQLITYLIIILLATACYDDYDRSNTTEDRELPETTMEGGLTGRVYNNDGSILTDYSLRINDQTYNQSDSYYEYIPVLRKFGQVIYLMDNEEILGFSNNLLIENDIYNADIIAFPDKIINTIASDAQTIEIDADLIITIDRNQLLNTSREIPQTDILVNHFSTSDIDILSQVGHHGYDSNKNLLILNPSRFFYLGLSSEGEELTTDDEGPLQLNNDFSSNSLFRLDEKGYWLEVSSESPFDITQSGYYLIAEALPGVYNEGQVSKGTKAVSYLNMQLSHELDNKKYQNKTSSMGRWAMVNYIDESISIEYTSPCNDRIDATNYELTADTQLDLSHEITADNLLLDVMTQVIDCNGQVSELPTISIQSNTNSSLYPYTENTIDTWIATCENDVDVTGYNIIEETAGPLLDWNISIEDAISYLSYCDGFEDGFSFLKIREDMNVYDSPTIEADGSRTKLSDLDNLFRLNFEGLNIGVYEKEDVRIFLEDVRFGSQGYRITCENSPLGCGIEDFRVSHIDLVGDGWTRITFSGTVWMQTISPPLSGNFPVEGIIMRR
ncbi:hypothetical protein N9L92_05225, partial [Saprospiraceae bacterium]|nr:hypothetical protein [Saprospiraceae bacterium]